MKRPLFLVLIFLVMTTVLFVLFCIAVNNLRKLMGWQENGFIAWFTLILVAIRWWRSRQVWQGGLAAAICNLIAWWAFRLHREDLRQAFDRLGDAILLITVLGGGGNWRRRLWGKLKSAGLTAVNAASFRRQAKEVLT